MIKDSSYVQSLIDYVNDVKPYSSKLVDVVVEYQFTDSFIVDISDLHTIQMNIGLAEHASVVLNDKLKIGLNMALLDTLNIKDTNGTWPAGYSQGGYDTAEYDMPEPPTATLASIMYENLSIVSTPISGGQVEQIISVSMPNAQHGDSFMQHIAGAKKVIINHYFGDTNPSGAFAAQGGVQIAIAGATATSITNPYTTNNPVLYTTTVIQFATPVTCNITVTVSRP